jgi:hypothetical protein
MKKRTIRALLLVAILALAVSAWAMTLSYSSGATGISVSQTNTNIPFTNNHSGGDSATFQAKHVLIRSRSASANTCHFDLGDGVATTADPTLAPGASIAVDWDQRSGGVGGGWSAIGVICTTAQTATWDIDAWR